jgi:hypothetical protein
MKPSYYANADGSLYLGCTGQTLHWVEPSKAASHAIIFTQENLGRHRLDGFHKRSLSRWRRTVGRAGKFVPIENQPA